MDVVAYAGAVRGVVVVAKDVQLGALADGHLQNVRCEVIGDALGVFADQAAFVRADGVEVAQENDVPAFLAHAHIPHDVLCDQLGAAVRVCGGQGKVLENGDRVRVAVYRRRRREDQVFAIVLLHGGQQADSGADVVLVVGERDRHRLAHSFQGRKVNYRKNFMLGEDLIKQALLGNVALVERDLLACDLLHPGQSLLAGVHKVVHHDQVVALVQQLDGGVAANITGASSNKDRLSRHFGEFS
mmetsp:Transcript_26001/g.65335  ORF Transcript_26001/g.65335 Transcript_26001/m.65335 type:complete len:243 (-) Transcript_26001:47-775(-)